MTLQSFEILINNETKIVKFETELSFGEVEKIVNTSLKFGIAQGDITVDMPNYRLSILLASIKEAPFEVSVSGIRNLPYSVMKQVNQEIFKHFPLAQYLVDWIATATGKTVKINEIDS